MIVIVCVDDNNGMMFNNRRQSKDRILQKEILHLIGSNNLWMNSYSKKQFAEYNSEQILVDENFLSKTEANDFCFVENNNLSDYADKIEKIILFKWNRNYPADMYFSIDLKKWVLEESVDFEGYSHEKITKEIYKR